MIRKYLQNGFLLMLPVMLWNIFLANKLPPEFQPEIFWKDIPDAITLGENISRFLLFLLAFLMPLKIETAGQKKALILYFAGLLLYFASWLPLIYFPGSEWSSSWPGFMAPAYTPILWLTGIGLIGNRFYFRLPYKSGYFFIVAAVFLLFHNLHTFIIFCRL